MVSEQLIAKKYRSDCGPNWCITQHLPGGNLV